MTIVIPPALSQRLASLRAARHLLVCSDYDGTLAPLAPRPEQAQLLPGASQLLLDLARLPNTRVAIVSGRSRENLLSHSGLKEPVLLVGSHGAERPGGTCSVDPDSQKTINLVQSTLENLCSTTPNAWIERKPLGLVVHVRQADPNDGHHLLAQVREALRNWPALYLTEGKAVLEISVARTGKGDAIRWLRDEWGTDPQILYLGDDVTDEAAFGALRDGDVGVKIGEGATCAPYRVTSENDALGILTSLWKARKSHENRNPSFNAATDNSS